MDTILQSHPGSNNHCKSAFLIWNVNVCYFKLIKFIAIAALSAAGVVPSNYRISSLWPLSSHNKNNIETRNLHVIAHYTKMRFKFSTDSLSLNKTHFLNLVSDKKSVSKENMLTPILKLPTMTCNVHVLFQTRISFDKTNEMMMLNIYFLLSALKVSVWSKLGFIG